MKKLGKTWSPVLSKEVSEFGSLVPPIEMVSLDLKSPQLKHVVCHRRHVTIVLKDTAGDLNPYCTFKVDNYLYLVFVSTEHIKCFWCCGASGLHFSSASGGSTPPVGSQWGTTAPRVGRYRHPWGAVVLVCQLRSTRCPWKYRLRLTQRWRKMGFRSRN